MQIIRPTGTIYERHMNENTRAEAAELRAVTDYNIMMGNLEDPAADDEEEEEDDE